MCKAYRLTHCPPHFLTDLKSILFYLPSIVVLGIILFSLDFTPARPYQNSCEVEQLSADNGITCYTANTVHLSEANTSQGFRIQTDPSGLRNKNPDSESFKNMVFHENYTALSKTPRFIARNNQSYPEKVTPDIPVTCHKLII